jgi:hypothetical protein
MKTGFIQNTNYARLLQAVKAVEQRGAKESSLLLVSGAPALGKSRAVERFSADNGALFLRATKNVKYDFFLRQLAEIAKVDLGATFDAKGKTVIKAATSKDVIKDRLTKKILIDQKPIVLDEVQHLLDNKAALLEVIRDISDRTQVLVILVAGEADFPYQLRKHPQISSRIYQEVEFQPWPYQDIKIACKQLCEVTIEDALIQRLTDESSGLMRLVMNGISNIERIAKANNKSIATLSDFAEQELVSDWDNVTQAAVRRRRR